MVEFKQAAGIVWALGAIVWILVDAIQAVARARLERSRDPIERALGVTSEAVLWPVMLPIKMIRRRRSRARMDKR